MKPLICSRFYLDISRTDSGPPCFLPLQMGPEILSVIKDKPIWRASQPWRQPSNLSIMNRKKAYKRRGSRKFHTSLTLIYNRLHQSYIVYNKSTLRSEVKSDYFFTNNFKNPAIDKIVQEFFLSVFEQYLNQKFQIFVRSAFINSVFPQSSIHNFSELKDRFWKRELSEYKSRIYFIFS